MKPVGLEKPAYMQGVPVWPRIAGNGLPLHHACLGYLLGRAWSTSHSGVAQSSPEQAPPGVNLSCYRDILSGKDS